MDQSPRGFASEDEEATYCLSLLRDGDRTQKIVARERLSQIFEQRGLLDEAAQCLESNIREGVRDPRVYQRLAGVYRRQGRHELAEEVLQEARRLAERQAGPARPGQRRPGPGRAPRPGPGAPGAPPPGPLEAPTAPLPASAPRDLGLGGELALDPPMGDLSEPPPHVSRPWFVSPAAIVLLILLCGPFGLALMWVRGGYAHRAKVTATAVWAGLMVLSLAAAAVSLQSYAATLAQAARTGQIPGVPGVPGLAPGLAPTPIAFPPAGGPAAKPAAGGPVTAPSPPALTASPEPAPKPGTTVIAPPGNNAGSGPAPGAAASASPVAAPAAAKPSGERVTVGNTDGNGANLRERPSSTSPTLKTVPDGTELQIVGSDQQSENRTWRNVRDDSGAQGWIAGELLTPVR